MANYTESVKSLIAEKSGKISDDIKLDATLVDGLGLDSVDISELLMDLEEAFDIKIQDEPIEAFTTVQSVVDYVNQHAKSS
ncbi:acyl carrier protein [Pseudomonas sp. MLB6B]